MPLTLHRAVAIYLVPVIGGQPSRLVSGGQSPRLSPDGRWVAYSSRPAIGGSVLSGMGSEGVSILPVSGGESRRIAADLAGPANPAWNPDSRHLLVYVPPKLGFQWNDADWWLVSIDGQRSQRTGDFSELKRRGFSLGFDRVPSIAEWSRNSITFAAGLGDSINVWRAPASDNGIISGPPSRLTSGTTLEVEPALSPNGSLIFASLNRSSAVWSLPADTNLGKVTGQIVKATNRKRSLQIRGQPNSIPRSRATGQSFLTRRESREQSLPPTQTVNLLASSFLAKTVSPGIGRSITSGYCSTAARTLTCRSFACSTFLLDAIHC